MTQHMVITCQLKQKLRPSTTGRPRIEEMRRVKERSTESIRSISAPSLYDVGNCNTQVRMARAYSTSLHRAPTLACTRRTYTQKRNDP